MALTTLTEEHLKSNLLEFLEDEDASPRPIAFSQTIPALPNPGLFIKDHGSIGLPVSETDAKAIIARCKQSPFGKGAETIVDETIRRTWELDPTNFELKNPKFLTEIDSLISTVCESLALRYPKGDVRAELFKLLVHEEGAFFKPHQDSEKTPGMFGTLVLGLAISSRRRRCRS